MLHPTPEMLAAAYELLRATPPLRGWRLPPADEVEFRVTRTRHQGAFNPPATISISAKRVATLDRLIVVMAHEMVHLHEHVTGCPGDAEHGHVFRRMAAQVCRYHLFDPKEF